MLDPITQYILEQEDPSWLKKNKSACSDKIDMPLHSYGGEGIFNKKKPTKPVNGVANMIISLWEKIRKQEIGYMMAFKHDTKSCKDIRNKKKRMRCVMKQVAKWYDSAEYGIMHYYIGDCAYDVNCVICYKKVDSYVNKLLAEGNQLKKKWRIKDNG